VARKISEAKKAQRRDRRRAADCHLNGEACEGQLKYGLISLAVGETGESGVKAARQPGAWHQRK